MERLTTLAVGCLLGAGLAAAATAFIYLDRDERIIGGEPAPRGAYPFFSTMVKADGSHICGASLIAPQWVLTAAHCFRGQSPSSVLVGLEQYRPQVVASDNVQIAHTFLHPDDDARGQFDIALVKLVRAANSQHFLKLDGMDLDLELQAGDPTLLVGFGRTEAGYGPDVLYQGEGEVLQDKMCIEVPEGYPDTNFNPENNLCAGYNQAGGDSGGPLMVRADGEYVEIGLVSRTLFAQAGQYTRIAYFADWIKHTMEQNK